MGSILDKCQNAPLETLAPGSVLLAEGKTSGRLYVLQSGAVEVVRGDTQVAVVDEPGAVFGEMSVLLNRAHTATVRALTPIAVYAFDDAERFLRSNPEIAFLIGRLLAGRLNAATTYLVDLKRQFEDHGDHLCMVGDVLDVLIHQQDEEFSLGPERDADPRL
ncbi:3',5'-cyclic-nucleotide phosphodiesterase [Methyloceanibacter superfactus]|jgi:CRP/FNR family transcriptional regulator, cyclic AMP receptor protein|uniref:3',5'-cyclic-nucleotide phosphodiesterase n=1 Tax=Methyloceanibacter superfactus TaxID=1774969 RepID=A0A1E3W5E8_9HYPH|nr:cyclic nucleotide-binding domain-containing protein [Methyloceanibacter superfactus]ODS00996.1 3',5'-cyclic-nucleotide phosphodiesterase [Methyloceanibacter superfactus]